MNATTLIALIVFLFTAPLAVILLLARRRPGPAYLTVPDTDEDAL